MTFPVQLRRQQLVARCHYSMNLCLVQPGQPGRHRKSVGVDKAQQLAHGMAAEVLIRGMRGSDTTLVTELQQRASFGGTILPDVVGMLGDQVRIPVGGRSHPDMAVD